MINSDIQTRVMRNVQRPSDGSSAATQALTDILQYVNECARDVWKRRVWREYLITGKYTVPAATSRITLAQITPDSGYSAAGGRTTAFYEVIGIRQGSLSLMPEDPGAINWTNPNVWDDSTTAPARWVSLGRDGVRLLGAYQTPTQLSFIGKAAWADMIASDTWVMDNENLLIAGATACFIRDNDYDQNRKAERMTEYEQEVQKMVDAAEAQAGNMKRIIPLSPWTDQMYAGSWNGSNISPTGVGNFF